ncbi:DMP19 family protein [Rossellomorea vietnamensis]|uniref:DMP19 family protein n=1 Tax=Rossellomorea TaxID=2837508 RepID=UPI0021CC91F0|nr:hypothetical protein [Rossellomorea aquimaris]
MDKLKPKMKRKGLMNNDGIWNAVTKVICEHDFPSEEETIYESFIVFHYFAELESGGHEMFLTWFSDHIKKAGIKKYSIDLAGGLEKIGADDYAEIVKKHLDPLWHLYLALETDESIEQEFYKLIEKADNDYHQLNGRLAQLLEAHFVKIHTDLIDVLEN